MNIFVRFNNNANDSATLDAFIRNNIVELSSFSSINQEEFEKAQDDFEQFVLLKKNVIENLEYSHSYNKAFIYYLVDCCERYNASSSLVVLYQIIQKQQLTIGARLEAALLFLYNVPDNNVFIDRYDEICNKLQIAIDEEEDDDTKVIFTFLNYYGYVVNNTSLHPYFSHALNTKYRNSVDNNTFPFLQNHFIQECLSIKNLQAEGLYNIIQQRLLEIRVSNPTTLYVNKHKNDILIETDTDYSRSLSSILPSFQSLRNLALKKIKELDNPDEIYHTLGRGVNVITDEAQLYSYIKSYGNMHEAKMKSALSYIPLSDLIDKNITIYDWGCGQGLATIILKEFINSKSITLNITNVVLIEPSELALKRATLHVTHFYQNTNISTILKDIDSTLVEDIYSGDGMAIHLLSNILDVEAFSLEHLVSLIDGTKCKRHLFVCASPYINDAKTARIDRFVNMIKLKAKAYKSYCYINETKGQWINNWSRVIRVFSIDI